MLLHRGCLKAFSMIMQIVLLTMSISGFVVITVLHSLIIKLVPYG